MHSNNEKDNSELKIGQFNNEENNEWHNDNSEC